MATLINRRQFERFPLVAAYNPVAIRFLDQEHFSLEGHAYDISEGGIQFELDHPIAPGTSVAIQITLTAAQRAASADIGPGRSIFVFANVVWLSDEEPGPVRMAAVFTRFARAGDRERLFSQISAGKLRRAA
jgi:hypothetical protein